MEFASTFDIQVGDVILHQQDVMALVEADDDDGWWISAVYADDYVEIPKDHYLYQPVLDFFMREHRDDIDDEWGRRHYRPVEPYSTIPAGRTL